MNVAVIESLRLELFIQICTSGPWKRLGSTKLIDITMIQFLEEHSSRSPQKELDMINRHEIRNDSSTNKTHVWAIASNGDALYRSVVLIGFSQRGGSNYKL